MVAESAGPVFGEAIEYVLCDLLGYEPAQAAELIDEGTAVLKHEIGLLAR